MNEQKRKNPNAGMTLLEVIIAVSIFSITAIVLLQGFVTSGRINRKSNLYLEATTTAQNIMEEVKAKTFMEVSQAFNYPLDLDGNTRINFLNPQKDKIKSGELGIREVLKASGSSGTVYNFVSKYREGMDESKVTASVISTDDGKTCKFNPRKKGSNASKYYFELTNVTANRETFDALVEFDGSESSGYKEKTVTGTGTGKNDYLAPKISDMDSKTNAFLIMPRNWDEEAMQRMVAGQKSAAIEAMNTDVGNNGTDSDTYQPLDWKDVYKYTKRTLHIKIEESGGIVLVRQHTDRHAVLLERFEHRNNALIRMRAVHHVLAVERAEIRQTDVDHLVRAALLGNAALDQLAYAVADADARLLHAHRRKAVLLHGIGYAVAQITERVEQRTV